MPRLSAEEWRDLFTRVERDAFHLELRDSYDAAGEHTRFGRWLGGEHESYEQVSAWFAGWTDLVRAPVRVLRRHGRRTT
ncbi:DUF6879 family protein [Sphaerisporangium sp. NPDC049002]|uniref:DUF6879 family protein n=1 Tax=unclassified Sphaerisporangium TaxID=2630420 RepID=UPI0033E39752